MDRMNDELIHDDAIDKRRQNFENRNSMRISLKNFKILKLRPINDQFVL